MSTSQTPNRNFTHPEKDEDLESSNAFMRINLFKIDEDLHALFTDKANSVDVYTKLEANTLVSESIATFGSTLDIYGAYTSGDVRGTTELNLRSDTFATPGVATKVTVNGKGLVIGSAALVKSDISDFNEADYLLATQLNDLGTLNTEIFSAAKVLSLISGVSGSQGDYVLLTSYTDAAVLAKIKNVDGTGSGLDADTVDGHDSTYFAVASDTYTKAEIATFADNYVLRTNSTTALRPAVTQIGYMHFDTTLTKPIWWSGTNWVDATGTIV